MNKPERRSPRCSVCGRVGHNRTCCDVMQAFFREVHRQVWGLRQPAIAAFALVVAKHVEAEFVLLRAQRGDAAVDEWLATVRERVDAFLLRIPMKEIERHPSAQPAGDQVFIDSGRIPPRFTPWRAFPARSGSGGTS